MNKILFLGGSFSQLPAIKYAKENNYYIIIADYLPNNPGRKLANEYYNISTTDINSIYKLSIEKKINAISSYASDPASITAAYVSEKLNLVGNTIKSVEILSRKNLFREFLKQENILTPNFISSNNINELITFQEKHKFKKLILKPTDSSGSKGVSIIKSREDLLNLFNDSLIESKTKNLILEEFIEKIGAQIHGEGFVVDGKLKFLLLGDQYFDKNKKLIPFSTIVPSIQHHKYMGKAFELVQKIIKKTGFNNGGINIEIIRSNNNKLFILEIGARSGGNYMPQLIKQATGIDLVKANIDILFKKKINFKWRTDPIYYYSQIILHSKESGFLKKITMPRELNGIVEQHLFYNIGEKINKYNSSRDVIGVNILRINKSELKATKYSDILYKENMIEVDKEILTISHEKKSVIEINNYLHTQKNMQFSPLEKKINLKIYSEKIFNNAEQFWLKNKDYNNGFAAVYMNNKDFAFITTISINKNYQNVGYGKKMIKKIITILKTKNIFKLKLEVDKNNQAAINFYKKNNFNIIKQDFNIYTMLLDLNYEK